MSEVKFVSGLFFKEKHVNAPDFVKGKLSINVKSLKEFLNEQEGEWVNCDIKEAKNGKIYIAVDTYVRQENNAPNDALNNTSNEVHIGEDGVPF